MIAKLLGQLLLASSLVRILPVDAAALEWHAGFGSGTSEPVNTVSSWFATLPKAEDRIKTPTKIDLDSYGIVTSAQSAIVVDAASGAVLFTKQADEVRAIGSITKLMTALVFLQTGPDLERSVELISDDYVGGGRVYLRFDDGVQIHDVLRASLVGSDNTATKSLARFSGLSSEDFLAKMNATAAGLGMSSSYFADFSGVDARNVSTAHDLTKLLAAAEANAVMADIMTVSNIAVTQASGFTADITSTDELLGSYLDTGEYRVVAGKTGFIPEAGYCFATTINKNDHAIRVVVLGAETKARRFSDAKGLAAWTFKTFSWE